VSQAATDAAPAFRRYRRTSLAIFTVAVVGLMIGAAEWILRRSGYLPGGAYFTVTKALTVEEKFTTDERGVFKANKPAWAFVGDVSINNDGFRGPEFAPPDSGQTSVLILGDSFAWGIGAEPVSNSFPDLIRQHGHRVYNTGIPGVDPGQYRLIADLYTPRLKPDHVVVAFYVGNDLLTRLYPAIPNRKLIHETNAGWILGFDACDRPLTAQEAYDYYIGTSEPLVGRLLLTTSLGTAAWNLMMGARSRVPAAATPGRCADGSQRAADTTAPNTATFAALQHIKDLAAQYGSQFHLLVIPSHGGGCNPALKNFEPYRGAFDRLDPIYLDDIPEDLFYNAPNCHIRNEGHRFIADRILARLNVTSISARGK
jgi:hypothetical protein